MLSNKVVLFASSLVILSAVGFGAYQFGVSQSQEDIQKLQKEKESAVKQQAVSPEIALEQDMRKMEARIKSVNASLEQLAKKSEKINNDLSELESPDDTILAQVQAQVDALPRSPEQKAVPLPAESSSAKVLAQPKSPSGIPKPVLENYQKETGVNPAEIEALMQRTQ